MIDELAVYSRALSASEIQAIYNSGGDGKCLGNHKVPIFFTSPTNQSVFVGDVVHFAVNAGGTAPFYYQWYLNQTNELNGQTNDTLTLANAQTNEIGTYSVVVTNSFGVTNSASAALSGESKSAVRFRLPPIS